MGKRTAKSLSQVADEDLENAMDEIDTFSRSRLQPEDSRQAASSDEEQEVLGIDVASSDEESEDSDAGRESEDESSHAWGKGKRAYYKVDTREEEEEMENEDEEQQAAALEEAEALRIQKARLMNLQETDFDEGMLELISEKQKSKAKAKGKGSKDMKALQSFNDELENIELEAPSHAVVHNLEHDLTKLTDEEKMDVLNRDSPELLSLLHEYNKTVKELTERVVPVVERVKCGATTRQGMSLLETKKHLLLYYAMNLSFYILLKAKGHRVANHPVITELVKIRNYLQRLKPMEKKLKSQINKLVKASTTGGVVDGEESETHEEEGDEAGEVEIEPSTSGDENQNQGKIEMESESDSEEIPSQHRSSTGRGKAGAVERFEEEDFLRMSLAKKGKKDRGQIRNKADLEAEDFGEFETLFEPGEEQEGEDGAYTTILSDLKASQRQQPMESGETDIPIKDLQKEKALRAKEQKKQHRKAEKEAKRAKAAKAGPGIEPVDNPVYDFFAQMAEQKEAEKTKKKREREVVVSEDLGDGKRRITAEILHNRGLVKYRKKEDRNARVKNRGKYDKLVKKRKSQVQDVKQKQIGYGGEETGIRGNTVKSTKLS